MTLEQKSDMVSRAGTGPAAPPCPRTPTLADRWFAARDRLIASQRFQSWAASFPLTRWAARRRANQLFDLCAGFVYAQVLRAAVELDVFNFVATEPRTIADIAVHTGLPLASAERLITAAIGLGLLQRRSANRVGLGMMGAALVGNPGIAAMVQHHSLLYADLADPVALLRRDAAARPDSDGRTGSDRPGEPRDTTLAGYWAYAGASTPERLGAADVAAYSDLMSQSQRLISGDILDAYPFAHARRLLDVGGGDGTFTEAAAARHPQLQLQVFDLPAVAERARARFVAAGIGDRATAAGGDFFKDPLPPGADVITMVRVLFDHDDDRVLTVLRQTRAALAPEGTLLIAEPLGQTPGAEAVTDAYYGFYLLAMGRGRTRSFEQMRALLTAAGYVRVRRVATRRPFLTSLVAAQC